nr:DNA damage-inducible protein 1-like [Tanacetum cinerariifolium]
AEKISHLLWSTTFIPSSESESSESESEDFNEIDIETLMLEQYLALNRNNSQEGVKRPGNGENLGFEINSQLLREIRENTLSGGKNEDAMEHLRKILEIAEDNKVPIILGRHMLATAHARIDVFGGKISLEVGKEQVIFNANEGATPVTVSPVCVIKNFDVIDNIEGPDDLEEFLMDDDINGDLGNFLHDNNLFPNYEDPGNDLWDDLDPGALTNEQPLKPEFLGIGNKVTRYSPYNLQITCKIGFVNFNPYVDLISSFNIMSKAAYNSIFKRVLVYTGNNIVEKANNLQVFIGCHSFLTEFSILENVNEFVEKRLTEVIFGKPFKEKIGLEADTCKGILWFKIGDDKTIFHMCRAKRRLSKLITEQQNLMSPILKISDKDKASGISHPYQKIKEFYKGCLNLREEYEQDPEVLSTRKWNSRSLRLVLGKRVAVWTCCKVSPLRDFILKREQRSGESFV